MPDAIYIKESRRNNNPEGYYYETAREEQKNNLFHYMIKVTYPMIAKHYGKHVQVIKYQAKKTNGIKTLKDLVAIINYYENKK